MCKEHSWSRHGALPAKARKDLNLWYCFCYIFLFKISNTVFSLYVSYNIWEKVYEWWTSGWCNPLTGNSFFFFTVLPPLLWWRISQRKFPEFDEVLEVSGWNKALTMPRPEKKFIFIALPSGGGSDSKCVHSVCDLDLPFCKAKTVWLELTFLGDFSLFHFIWGIDLNARSILWDLPELSAHGKSHWCKGYAVELTSYILKWVW